MPDPRRPHKPHKPHRLIPPFPDWFTTGDAERWLKLSPVRLGDGARAGRVPFLNPARAFGSTIPYYFSAETLIAFWRERHGLGPECQPPPMPPDLAARIEAAKK